MTILGIGYDQTELERIRITLERFGERFLQRCYTAEERAFCFRHADPIPRLAARYAAKEAGAKALGTGIAKGILWREIEVLRKPGHRPTLQLHGRAAEQAHRMGVSQAHVTLCHSQQLGSATVILEGRGESD